MCLNPCGLQCGLCVFLIFLRASADLLHFVRCKVKTGVVGVPCGIEGSMVNEFVEALDSEE